MAVWGLNISVVTMLMTQWRERLTAAHLIGLACVVAGPWLSAHARSAD